MGVAKQSEVRRTAPTVCPWNAKRTSEAILVAYKSISVRGANAVQIVRVIPVRFPFARRKLGFSGVWCDQKGFLTARCQVL